MLSSRERLVARQGQSGTPRHEYLQQLVSEYARSQHWLRKEEIVANLANFAYDRINYGALQRLRVMELFVEIIVSADRDDSADVQIKNARRDESASVAKSKRLLVEFAMGGICNCIPDPSLQISFIESDGVAALLQHVASIPMDLVSDSNIAPNDLERRELEMRQSLFNMSLSALTITYFLLDSPAFASVSTDAVMTDIQRLCRHPNARLANVAKAYLSRYDELLASVEGSTS